jgi:hypothetical protein
MKNVRTLVFGLSGPMTGCPNTNFEMFQAAEKFLKDHDIVCINPWTRSRAKVIKKDNGYAIVLSDCIRDLSNCDALLLLPGWESSPGSLAEYAFMKASEKYILDFGEVKTWILESNTPAEE